jgi:hypothetical protein
MQSIGQSPMPAVTEFEQTSRQVAPCGVVSPTAHPSFDMRSQASAQVNSFVTLPPPLSTTTGGGGGDGGDGGFTGDGPGLGQPVMRIDTSNMVFISITLRDFDLVPGDRFHSQPNSQTKPSPAVKQDGSVSRRIGEYEDRRKPLVQPF